MKNLFSIFLAFLFPVIAFSQEAELLKDEDYIRHEKEMLEFYNSEEYQNYHLASNEFISKISNANFSFEQDDEESFEKWLDYSFEQTEFESKEEALEIYRKYQDAKPDEVMNKLRAIHKKG